VKERRCERGERIITIKRNVDDFWCQWAWWRWGNTSDDWVDGKAIGESDDSGRRRMSMTFRDDASERRERGRIKRRGRRTSAYTMRYEWGITSSF
jgi:hypothetical protein